ncbi:MULTISPECIES: ABC transporter substrate-binding protein [unclassified Pseudoclavibacter]|uniref:ABC transporter substrate-binding protein n=1 Tax=unclassified Pseudoclavibacter TaxID=2615177 RepID=UPI0012EFD950|nr:MULTISPECIES: extracellular solute-binding protein [unclassified Pseudoclavibacter]MBF4457372.1 extracellular solute-binding protein [Pseudoclavibacter sp. VKM Ac-2867]VXC43854.1 Sugar ABC transporter substrate-binding protein [Pseudoclavibacter sp. 8L]
MKKRTMIATAGLAAAALALTGCSGGGSVDPDGPITLSVSGWSVASTPEFQLLADGFTEKYPDVTVEVVDYDPAEYNTLITADLAAGSGPDIITQKEIKFVTTFQEGGQLLDVSDVALPEGISGAESYNIDGTTWAVPYRQDSWVLYYNKALFDEAGVAYPDGSWTWDDYVENADLLTTNLASAGSTAKGAHQHSWQSTVQGFANAQAGGDIFSGEYDYFAPYYDKSLKLQDDGAQASFNTVTANKLTYQGEFGKQNAAMIPMGSWFVATLISQQASGEADDFEWGIAPVPQMDASTTGMDNTPVTFGDPAGFGINANIDEGKTQAAKDFLAYAASEEAATKLAGIGITPALLSDPVVEAYFAVEGAPQDELSAFAVQTHETLPESPTNSKTAAVQNILNDMHSSILSGSKSVQDSITEAEGRVANEVGLD